MDQSPQTPCSPSQLHFLLWLLFSPGDPGTFPTPAWVGGGPFPSIQQLENQADPKGGRCV